MLGKLMKYEFKATYRLFLVFYLGIVSFFALGLIGRALDISQVRGTAMVFLVLAGVGALFAALFYMVTRYYRNVFGAEGYLTQTLPVHSGQILASKMLVTFVWFVVGAVGLFLSIAGALVLYDLHGEAIEFLKALPGEYVTLLVIFAAVILCSLFALINEVFFAVTLAHTRPFLQNGILMAVVFYFALNMAVGLLEAAGLMIFPLGVELTQSGWTFTTETMLGSMIRMGEVGENIPLETFLEGLVFGLGSCIVDLLCGVGLLFGSAKLLKDKTSVK